MLEGSDSYTPKAATDFLSTARALVASITGLDETGASSSVSELKRKAGDLQRLAEEAEADIEVKAKKEKAEKEKATAEDNDAGRKDAAKGSGVG
eukprot:8306006-Alexandrium_andersonii.AAC.1